MADDDVLGSPLFQVMQQKKSKNKLTDRVQQVLRAQPFHQPPPSNGHDFASYLPERMPGP